MDPKLKGMFNDEDWQRAAGQMAQAVVEARSYAPWQQQSNELNCLQMVRGKFGMVPAAYETFGLNIGQDSLLGKHFLETVKRGKINQIEDQRVFLSSSIVHERTHVDRRESQVWDGFYDFKFEIATQINEYLFEPQKNEILNNYFKKGLNRYFKNTDVNPIYDPARFHAMLIIGLFLAMVDPEYQRSFVQGRQDRFQTVLNELIGRSMRANEKDFMVRVLVPVLAKLSGEDLFQLSLAIQENPEEMLNTFIGAFKGARIGDFSQLSESPRDQAMDAVEEHRGATGPGGIDLNAKRMKLDVESDKAAVSQPMDLKVLDNIEINGLYIKDIEIKSLTNLPEVLGVSSS